MVYSTAPVLAAERELKYGLPAARADIALRLLERYCQRDPAFPAAVVWTLDNLFGAMTPGAGPQVTPLAFLMLVAISLLSSLFIS